jgi:hypothetical protein
MLDFVLYFVKFIMWFVKGKVDVLLYQLDLPLCICNVNRLQLLHTVRFYAFQPCSVIASVVQLRGSLEMLFNGLTFRLRFCCIVVERV